MISIYIQNFPLPLFIAGLYMCCSWAYPYDWDNVNYDTLLGYCDCWGPLGLAKWFRWGIRPYQQCHGVLSSWTGPRSDILVQKNSKTWRSVARRTTLAHKMMLLHIKWRFFLERISGDIELQSFPQKSPISNNLVPEFSWPRWPVSCFWFHVLSYPQNAWFWSQVEQLAGNSSHLMVAIFRHNLATQIRINQLRIGGFPFPCLISKGVNAHACWIQCDSVDLLWNHPFIQKCQATIGWIYFSPPVK